MLKPSWSSNQTDVDETVARSFKEKPIYRFRIESAPITRASKSYEERNERMTTQW